MASAARRNLCAALKIDCFAPKPVPEKEEAPDLEAGGDEELDYKQETTTPVAEPRPPASLALPAGCPVPGSGAPPPDRYLLVNPFEQVDVEIEALRAARREEAHKTELEESHVKEAEGIQPAAMRTL